MLIYIKDEDDELVIPVGLGPNVGPEPQPADEEAENQE